MRSDLRPLLLVGMILAWPGSLAAVVIEPPINTQINAPTNLRRIELNWEASPSEGVTYRIYRSGSAANPGGIIADKQVVFNFVDTTVEYGVTYYYRLAAVLDGVESILTAPLFAAANLAPPQNIAAADTTQGGEIKITWERPTPGLVLTYNIYRSTNERDLGNRVASALAAVEYYDKQLENGARYFYRLKSVDTTGREGRASEPVMALASDKRPPAPPRLGGNFVSPDQAALAWSAPPDERTLSYIVYRSPSPGVTGDRLIQTSDTSYQQYSLPLGAVYYYGVVAIDGSGNVSELSQQVKIAITPPAAVTATPKVTNLTAEGTVKAGEILLRWQPPSDSRAASARVYRALSSYGETFQIADRVAGSSYLDKTAQAGQRYYYIIRLVGKDGAEYQTSAQASAVAFDPANPSLNTIVDTSRRNAPSPAGAWAGSAGGYAYGKPRLTNLALEAALSNDLRRALIKKLGTKAVPRILHPNLAKAYLYGGYVVDEIARTISVGPGLVHPIIPAVIWRHSDEYRRHR